MPEEVRGVLNIQLVESLDEVLTLALEDACPTDAGAADAAVAADEAPPVWTTDQPPSQSTPTMAD